MSKSNFLFLLISLLGVLFPLKINAQAKDPTLGIDDPNAKLTPHAIVAGIVLIVTGITFCFFGRRIYRLTLFLIGFYIGTIVTWVSLVNANVSSLTIILIVSLAVGFLVGLIFMCCSTLAIWFLGALAGYTLALFILAWTSASTGFFHSNVARVILIVVLTAGGLFLACCLKNPLIILGTAFIGSYAIILGIDFFVRTGFAQSVRAFMDARRGYPYETNTKIYLMLGGMIGLFILGSIFQFKYHKNHFGPDQGAVQPESGKRRFRFWQRRTV